MSGSEVEYLEEYKDLICGSTDDGQNKILTPSTTPPDEDSSSIDQDIFESLFEDNSDEENSSAAKKCFTKVSREDRSSLDSLDMLCKDLGEQIGVPPPSKTEGMKKTGHFGSTRLNSFTLERPAVNSLDTEIQKPTIIEGVAAIKTKSVATVRPTLQHQQQRSLPKARLHSDNRVTPLGRKIALEEPSTSKAPLNVSKRNLGNSTIRNSPVDQTKMIHRLNRPQPTIFKPEKHQSKDPAEDPLSLDNVATDLQCDLGSNSSLSELSDNESYVSLSDLDEDARNTIDLPNDTHINYTRCDKFRASTPSPTVSEFLERHYQRKSGFGEDLSILSSTSSAESEYNGSAQLCSKSLNMVKNWKMKNNVNAFVKCNANRLRSRPPNSHKAVISEKTMSGKSEGSANMVSSTATDLNNRILTETVQKRSTNDKMSSQKKNQRVYRQTGDKETIRHEHHINGKSENGNTSTHLNLPDSRMEQISENKEAYGNSSKRGVSVCPLLPKVTSTEKICDKFDDHIDKGDCPNIVTETKKATASIKIDLKFNNEVASPPITPMSSENRNSKTSKQSKDFKSVNKMPMSSEKRIPKPSKQYARATISNTSLTAKRLHVSEVNNVAELVSKKRKEDISKKKVTKSNIGAEFDAEEGSKNDESLGNKKKNTSDIPEDGSKNDGGFLENKNKYTSDVSTTEKHKTVIDTKIQDSEFNASENSQDALEKSICSVPKAATFSGFKNKSTLKGASLEKGNMQHEGVKSVGRKKKQKPEAAKEPSPKVRRIDDDPPGSNTNQKAFEIIKKDDKINCSKPIADISLESKKQCLESLNTQSTQSQADMLDNTNENVKSAMPSTSDMIKSTVNKGENINNDILGEKGNTSEVSSNSLSDVKSHETTKEETIALPKDNLGSSVNSIHSKPTKRSTKTQNPKLIASEECVKNKEMVMKPKKNLKNNVNEDCSSSHTESKRETVNLLTLTECASKQTTVEQKCPEYKNSIESAGAVEPSLNKDIQNQSSSNLTVGSQESAEPPNNKACKSNDGIKSKKVVDSFPGESCCEHPKTRMNQKHKRSELDGLKDCMPSDMLQLVEKNQDNVRQLKKRCIVKTPCIMTASATTNIKESEMKDSVVPTKCLDEKLPRLPKKSNRNRKTSNSSRVASRSDNPYHITLRKCRILLDEDFVPNYLKKLSNASLTVKSKENCEIKSSDMKEKRIGENEGSTSRKTVTTEKRLELVAPKPPASIQSTPTLKKSSAIHNKHQSSTSTNKSVDHMQEFRPSENLKSSSSKKCLDTKLKKSTVPSETISSVPSVDNACQKVPKEAKDKSPIEFEGEKRPRTSAIADISTTIATTLCDEEQQPTQECTQRNANSKSPPIPNFIENQDNTNDSNAFCSTALNTELRNHIEDAELNKQNEDHELSGAMAHPNNNENVVHDRFAPVIHGNEDSVVEPKRELDIDEQNFNDLSAIPSSSTLRCDYNSTSTNIARLNSFNLTPAIIDSSGTRLYSFLHPAKYNKNHCTVLLDYCCPNLDGPMAAIDPTRIHAQMQTLVRELPSYIVMKTELITRADLETNRGRIPASIRQKVEKITSVTQPTVGTTPPQPQVDNSIPPTLVALQNRLPAATRITPRNGKDGDRINLRINTARQELFGTESTQTVSGNPVPPLRSLLPQTTQASSSNDVAQRNALRMSLRRLDVLLRKLGQRFTNTSNLERGRCIESIVNDAILSLNPKDVDAAERVLDVFTKRLKTQCDAVSNASVNNKTSPNGSGPISRRISKSTATPANVQTDQNVPKLNQIEMVKSGSTTSGRRSRPSARRNMPIYDSEQNIIGYQMQVVKAAPNLITMSSVGKTSASPKTAALSASTISMKDQSQLSRMENSDSDTSRNRIQQVEHRVGTCPPNHQAAQIVKRSTKKTAPTTLASTMTKIIVVAKNNANGQTAEPQQQSAAAADECILPDHTESTQIKKEQLEEDNS